MKYLININKEDYIHFLRFIFTKNKWKNRFVIGFAFCAFFITDFVKAGDYNIDLYELFSITLSLVFFILMLEYLIPKLYIPSLAKRPKFSGEKELTFSNDGIDILGDSLKLSVHWNSLLEINETEEQFIFFTSNTLEIIIPKRYFLEEKELIKIKEMLKEKSDKLKIKYSTY